MSIISKRSLIGRGKGYLNAAGPQSRFIVFLIFVLMAYTLLLRVFQKFAEILQLPLFLPISLLTLLVFIGVVGTVYSHSFVGPMIRIRRALDQLAEGDTSFSLRLRESDDPMLKDIADSIAHISEHMKTSHGLIETSAQALMADIRALENAVHKGADRTELMQLATAASLTWSLLDQAIRSAKRS